MSALLTGLTGWPSPEEERPRSTAKLRPVPAAAPRLARRPFAVVLIVLFAVGMTGLLMLNTTLQNQAFESRTLTRQATQLAHVQADLQTQLDSMAAAPELARRASDLGMRANPKPAFLVVPSGKIIGEQYRVRGNEMPGLVVKTERQLQADDRAAAAKQARQKADQGAAKRTDALQADNQAIADAEAKAKAAKAPAGAQQGQQNAQQNTQQNTRQNAQQGGNDQGGNR